MYEVSSKDYDNVKIVLPTDLKQYAKLKSVMKEYSKQISPNNKQIIMPPFLSYFSSFLNILSMLAEN